MMKPRAKRMLAFDIGAASGRAMIGQFDGRRIKLKEVHRFPNGPVRVGDHLYSDVLQIWNEIQAGLQKATAQPGVEIASIGLDTWGVDYALLDANDQLLANPYHYRDERTADMLAYAGTLVPREDIYQQTGNVLIGFNTLFQLLSTARSERPLFDAARSLLMLPDVFNFWLSGQKASEFTIATTSQCYDPLGGDWAWGLLNKMGIPAHLFQRVVQPGTVLGTLRPWLAEQNSCAEIPVIAPACHDTGSAVAAVPATGKEFLYISSGTWSLVGVELERPYISAHGLESNLTNEGGVGGRFRFLKITPGMWPLQQCREEWRRQGKHYTYDDLTALAAAAPAFGPLIFASAPELNTPGDMPAKIRAYCRATGQAVPETEGEIVRCILESLALQYRSILLSLEALLGRSIQVIHVIGGGSRNRLLNSFTAGATGRRVVAGPVEATAVGNLLVQAMGLGYLRSLEEIREVVSNSFCPEVVDPMRITGWEDAFERYLKICELRP